MNSGFHKVVIVGGGAGGLELAAKLGRRFGPRHVVLVDKETYHIWKPSLHEVAAGTLDVHREGLSYGMVAKDCGFAFVPGEVERIDRSKKTICLRPFIAEGEEEILPARTLSYDTLVLAIGSKANFFGTPGANEHALALDSTEQAERFRLKLLRALAAVNRQKATYPERVLNIAIVGGGATGVELAAELTEAFADLVYYGLADLDPKKDLRITILEGAPRILAPLPEPLAAAAHQLLQERGVTIRTSVRVTSVTVEAVYDDKNNCYPSDLCVWAAGIQAPLLLADLGLHTNRVNQLIVDASLQSADPAIFAFGDCAQVPWGDEGKFLPARAQVAHQQASFLVRSLAQRIQGRPVKKRKFEFHDRGSLVSIGTSQGIGSLMGVLSGKKFFVHGLVGRLMYMSLHLLHHQAFLGTALLALGRLLLRRSEPRVKLH
ncbi:MAG TPA: NAD(P)/FAD-dependent oxidoreductase [Noviherbaspirillum sp.]|nr:NAD(P)/FAD-dependent oxidoreductase [Noviherbaspirillum sp.]